MENNIPFITIIITFYNEEILLSRCLESIKNQTFKNYDLILVNDGSTDKSLEIVKKYQLEFEYFNVISIEKSGLATARNIGLQSVKTKYVTFLDADDEFFPNFIEVFTLEIEKTSADLLICDFQAKSEDGKELIPSKWFNSYQKINNSSELLTTFYKEGIVETVWSKVFLTSIAIKIPFHKELKLFDDRTFLLEFILSSKTVSFITKKLMINYCRKSSMTRKTLSEIRINDVYQLFEIELAIIKKYKLENECKKGVFKNTLDYFMDTYLIQIIDREEIINLNEIRTLYQIVLKKYLEDIKNEQFNFDLKNKIALILLQLPKTLGWKITNIVISNLKQKRLQTLKKIKNQK